MDNKNSPMITKTQCLKLEEEEEGLSEDCKIYDCHDDNNNG